MSHPASQFIEEAVKHPDWLKTVETGQAEAVVKLANDQGFGCSLDDLKQAARELLTGSDSQTGKQQPAQEKIDEAASGLSDLDQESGYGDDTGYAALYGIAGALLKM